MKMVCLCALLVVVGLVRARGEGLVAKVTVADGGGIEKSVTRAGANMDELLQIWASGNQFHRVRGIEITNGRFTVHDWHKLRSMSPSLINLRLFEIKSSAQVEDIPDNEQERNPILKHCQRVVIQGLRTVGKNAFDEAEIQQIVLPHVVKIGANAFYGCGRLWQVEVPQLQEIGTSAFRSCYMLNSITLPSIRRIANSAFKACLALNYLKLNVTNALEIDNSGEPREARHKYPIFSECASRRVVVPCDAQGRELRDAQRAEAISKLLRSKLKSDANGYWQGFMYSTKMLPSISIAAADEESRNAGYVYAPPSFEVNGSIELRPFLKEHYTLVGATMRYMSGGVQVEKPIEGRTFEVPQEDVTIVWTARRNKMKMRINEQPVEVNSISEGLEALHLTAEGVTSFELLEGSLEEWGWRVLAEMKNTKSIRIRPTVTYCAPARSTVSPWGTTLKWTALQYLELSKLEHVRYTTLMLSGLQTSTDLLLEMFPNIRTIEPGGLRHMGRKVRVVGMPAMPPVFSQGGPHGEDRNALGSIGRAYLVPMDAQGVPLEGQELEAALERYAREFSGGDRDKGWNGHRLRWYRAMVDPASGSLMTLDSPFGIYDGGEMVTVAVKPGLGGKKPKVHYTYGGNRVTVNGEQFTMPNANITLTADWDGVPFAVSVKDGIQNGTIVTDPCCQAPYNTTVTIICKPDDEYQVREGSIIFTYRDPATGEMKTEKANKVDDNRYTLVMPAADVEVTGMFERLSYYRIQQDPGMTRGTVDIEPNLPKYGAGTLLTLKAKPAPGYIQAPNTQLEYTYTSSLADWRPVPRFGFRMPASDIVVRAHFVVNPDLKYNVTVDPRYANGQIKATPSSNVVGETSINLELAAPRGKRFKNLRYCKGSAPQEPWTPISGIQFKLPTSDVYVTGDLVTNPNAKWKVTVDPSVPAGCLTADPNEMIEAGEKVRLLANQSEYILELGSLKWRRSSDPEGWNVIGHYAIFSMPDEDAVVKGTFKKKPTVGYTVQQSPNMRNGYVEVLPTKDSYAEGELLEFYSRPAQGYRAKPNMAISYALTSALHDWIAVGPVGSRVPMPASDIVVRAYFEPDPDVRYTVQIDPNYAGMIAVSPEGKLMAETDVFLKLTPPRGKRFKNLRYHRFGGPTIDWISIRDGHFQMPPSNVYVTGDLEEDPDAKWSVYVDPAVPHGCLAANPARKIVKGERVRVLQTYNAELYEMEPGSVKWRLKDANPPQWMDLDGLWEFVMPDGDVLLTGKFKEKPKVTYRIQQDPAMRHGRVLVTPEQEDYIEGTKLEFKAETEHGYRMKPGTSIEYARTSALDTWTVIPKDFTMPAADIVVRVHVEVDPSVVFQVKIDPAHAEHIKATPSEGVAAETLVRLTLTPPRGQRLDELRYCLGTEPAGPWTPIRDMEFRMPASHVCVTGNLEINPNAKWSVTVDPSVPEGGLSASPSEKIERGETVFVLRTYDPKEYELVDGSLKWSLKEADPPEWTAVDVRGAFVMPDGDVVIKGEFRNKTNSYETFTVQKEVVGQGVLTVQVDGEPIVNGTQVRGGTDLEIAAEPAPGYALSQITVNDEMHWESKFNHAVRSNVEIKAYFVVSEDNPTDVTSQHVLLVSPNPFGELLRVGGEGLKRITLYSVVGQEVLRISQGFDGISTQHVPAGMYVLRAEWQDGAVTTHRLVRR